MLIAYEINNVNDTFDRTVYTQLAEKIALQLGISNDLNVKNLSRDAVRGTKGGRLHQTTIINWNSNENRIIVRAESDVTQEALMKANLQSTDTRPVFADQSNDIYLFPKYVSTKVTLAFSVTTRSRNEADLIIARYRSLTSSGQYITLDEVDYTYNIPLILLNVLKKLHEFKLPLDNVTLADWMSECKSPKITLVSDLSGTNVQPVVEEHQENLYVIAPSDSKAEITETSSKGTTTIEFTYNIVLDRPHSMQLQYPMIIQGRPIPKDLRRVNPYVPYNKSGHTSTIIDSVRNLDVRTEETLKRVILPDYDEWEPEFIHPYVNDFLSMVVLPDEDLRTIGSLVGIPSVNFHDETLDYMRAEHAVITTPYGGFISIDIHEDDKAIANGLSLDSDLNLSTTFDMRSDCTYRILFCANFLPLTLSRTARNRTITHPEFLTRLFRGLGWSLEDLPEEWDSDTLEPMMIKQNLRAKGLISDMDRSIHVNTFLLEV